MSAIDSLLTNKYGRLAITASVCLVWMSFSSGLIFINKWIMAVDDFRFPMALSGLGMIFSSVASYLVCKVFKLVDANKEFTWYFYLTRIMPVGLFMALTLAFGNLVYLHLTVAFIQMLKAFTPVITMACTFVAGLERPHLKLVSAVVLIALGVAAASYGELNFSLVGVLIMFLSELFESVRLVMTQILLQGHNFNAIEGLMYMAPACVFWLAIGSACTELKAMIAANALQKMMDKLPLYLCAAGMGFAVNATAYLTIQLAGSLTLKVLGTVKNAVVVWAGAVFWLEHITPLQLGGYSISIGGFGLYNWHKMQGASSAAAAELKSAKDGYARVPTADQERNETGMRAASPKAIP